jgi:hypothetical protein
MYTLNRCNQHLWLAPIYPKDYFLCGADLSQPLYGIKCNKRR